MPHSPHRGPLHRRPLHRRSVLAGAGLAGAAVVGGLGALHLLPTGGPADGNDVTPPAVDAGDLRLRTGDATHPGRVTVVTAAGRELVHLDGYRFSDSLGTRGATVTAPTPDTVHVDFEVPADAHTAAVTYRVTGGTVTADWEFTLPQDTGEDALRGGRIWRTLVDAVEKSEIHVPATRWTRDPRGGVPYLERTTEHHYCDWRQGDALIRGVFTAVGSRDHGAATLHAPATREADGVFRTTVTFRTDLTVAEARDLVDAGRPLLAGGVLGHPVAAAPVIDVRAPGSYGVLADGGAQSVTVGVVSTPGDTVVDVVARDIDGTELHRSTATVTVPTGARHGDTDVDIDLPGPRTWACVEVRCGEVFARTAVAVWPEHTFGPAEDSIIGLGGFSSSAPGSRDPGLESAAEERALWARLGVRHLRNPWLSAEESRELGIRTAVQPAGDPGQFNSPDAQSFDEWAQDALTRGADCGAEHYELLNEWNAHDPDSVEALATEYTDRWLKPFRAALDAADNAAQDSDNRDGTGASLIGMALAGWDPGFLDTVRARGGWELLDGIAEHAGRGNYTADYDGGRWNFHGQLRRTRAYLDGHPGPGQLWLTEAYACTCPNSWWYDDERTAADAVLLTLVLSRALGVTGVHWFQLTDGVWHDRYGVSVDDPEYHYGLFHVDRSPKPSAVAFAFAAEILDGAEFLGWIESPHPDLRGLRWTRDGKVFWVLWSRQDGYITHATHGSDGFFPFPEPWEVGDGASLRVRVPVGSQGGAEGGDTDRGSVVVRDVFGRELPTEGPEPGRARGPAIDPAGPGQVVTVGASPVVVSGDIDEFLTGPAEVTGDMSVPLTGVSVRREGTTLVIEGDNGTGGELTLRILGRQVDGEVEVEVRAPAGRFSERVDLGAAMPGPEAGAGESAVGVAPGNRPQVRIMAQRSATLTPDAAQPQVWRAEYHRSV